MARYTTTIRSPKPPSEAFAYMSDLRNFAAWDPGVRSVTQVTGDGGGPNASFDVAVAAGRGETTLRYVTTRYVPDDTVQVEARSRVFTSIDRVDVIADGSGSRVTYDADLRLNGPLGVFDLALRPVFRKIGDRAANGLVVALEGKFA
jgi:carbon monoxide dehydrogenase subunit G